MSKNTIATTSVLDGRLAGRDRNKIVILWTQGHRVRRQSCLREASLESRYII